MGDLLGGALGATAGGLLGMIGQNQQNQANIGLQNAAENWETQMANTTAQRSVADLKAAGLNPILAAGGSIDPTPSINPTQVSSPISAGIKSAENSSSSVMDLMQGAKDLQVKDSQKKLNEANSSVANMTAGIKSVESDVMSDADEVYKKAKSRFLDWFNKSGFSQTSAKDLSPLYDAGKLGKAAFGNIPSDVPQSAGGGLQ